MKLVPLLHPTASEMSCLPPLQTQSAGTLHKVRQHLEPLTYRNGSTHGRFVGSLILWSVRTESPPFRASGFVFEIPNPAFQEAGDI